MNSPRYQAAAVLLPNGKLLMAGGVNTTAAVASAEVYDYTSGSFVLGGSIPAPPRTKSCRRLP